MTLFKTTTIHRVYENMEAIREIWVQEIDEIGNVIQGVFLEIDRIIENKKSLA